VAWRCLSVRCNSRMRPHGPTGLWSIGPNSCPIWSLSDHHGQRKGSPRSSRPPRGHPCPKTGQRSPIVTEFAGAPPLEPSRPTPLPRRCPVLVPVPISAGSSTRPVPLPVDARFGLRTNKSGLLYAAPRTLGARFSYGASRPRPVGVVGQHPGCGCQVGDHPERRGHHRRPFGLTNPSPGPRH
jgi:hypothetical protein